MNWLSKISEGQDILVKNNEGIRLRKVSKIKGNKIYCGHGEFSRTTGIRFNSKSAETIIEPTEQLIFDAKQEQKSALLRKRISNCKLSEVDHQKLVQIATILGV